MTTNKFVHKCLKSTLLRYALVGGTSYIIELGCLLAIYHFGHTSRAVATAIAFWIGLVVAFLLQKLVAFQNYQCEVKALSRQGMLYGLLQLWNYAFTIAFVSLFGGNIIVARTVAQAIFSIWNYILYKRVIFKNVAGSR